MGMGGVNRRDLFIFSIAVAHLVVLLHSAEAERNDTRCPPHFCNEIVGNINFPFKSKTHLPECGFYTVDCSKKLCPKIQLKEEGYWHEFEGPLTTTVYINDKELRERFPRDSCNDEFFDLLSLPIPSPNLDAVSVFTHNLTLFKCNNTLFNSTSTAHPDNSCRNAYHTYYINSSENSLPNPTTLSSCSTIQIPMHPDQTDRETTYSRNLQIDSLSALTTEFVLQVVPRECYPCYERKGHCLVDKGVFTCSVGVKGSRNPVDIARVGAVVVIISLGAFVYFFFLAKQTQNDQIIDNVFLRSYGPLQVRRYSYLEVKKMTNSCKEKLGQGGYGSVYKGKLQESCLVAVKVLTKITKGNGKQFMNEVATISRTSHVNIVSLLGFCFEGSERALIYEFMPNGSLEKFIFDANITKKDHNHLGWETLDRISLGIARGLEYLHRGCNTRILHFDIKPHNILLDKNFTPKIADFGLAKICNKTESIVSMWGARGTVGYIAPEVFCRNFGRVSHKSDVYSYGMMLSEMVGGRKNINVEAEDTSEIYFPHWIYKRLELDEELGLKSIMHEEDKVRARKMIIVSLWCIQTDPSNRPAMGEVINMLEGSVDSLQIPPKPYLSSSKSPEDSTAILVSSIQ